MSQQWLTYEEVVAYLVDRYKELFGVERVEGKQTLSGPDGGEAEVDLVAYSKPDGLLICFECKDHARKINQDYIFAIEGKRQYLGASKSFIVTSHGLQSGAEGKAEYFNIGAVHVPNGATVETHIIRFMDKAFAAVVDSAIVTEIAFVTDLINTADEAKAGEGNVIHNYISDTGP